MNTEQFWQHVDKSGGPDACWPWTGAKGDKGHGRAYIGGHRYVSAQRLAYDLANGTDSRDLCGLHKCDNPPCCNPDHIFIGTRADNSHDMAAKGRARSGKDDGRTHCPHGHEYTPENTRIRRGKHRECRECIRARDRLRHTPEAWQAYVARRRERAGVA